MHYNGSSQAQGARHSKLLFHVTVFNVENRQEDFALRTRQAWRWEMMRRHSSGRPRVILVLALPNELYHLWQHYPWRLGHLACDIKAEWATLIGRNPSRYCALIG